MSNEFGREIDLEKANAIIGTYKQLEQAFDMQQNTSVSNELDQEMLDEFKSTRKKNNAFIFERRLIERFFKANPAAEYLVVLLGAHPAGLQDSKKGSFTVVTAGCTGPIDSKNPDGKLKLKTLDLDDPGNQYPGKRANAELVMPAKGPNHLIITFE